MITFLDDKIKSMIKNLALAGNTSMGGGDIVSELEEAISKLKADLGE